MQSEVSPIKSSAEWVSDVEAARIIGVSAASLRRWRQRRMGPPYRKVGGHLVRYRRSDLEHWLLKSCEAGGDALNEAGL